MQIKSLLYCKIYWSFYFWKILEVLLRTYCVGICGSDVHYWKRGVIGNFVLKDPIILGHETCAEVVAVGPDVTNLKVGDRVCTEPAVPCRICANCKEGRYNLCKDAWCHATPPKNGTLTKFFLHPADFSFKYANYFLINNLLSIKFH